MINKYGAALLLVWISLTSYSQSTSTVKASIDSTLVSKETNIIDTLTRRERRLMRARTSREIDPLSPSKAAFYSALVPGLGQVYNKRYWKVPIVYGAIGSGIYFYDWNKKEYDRYRGIYKRRLAGFTDDEFYLDSEGNQLTTPRVSDQSLREAQKFYQRNKDLSLLVTVGLYVLNIIDANVDAHLKQYNVNDNLSLQPYIRPNDLDYRMNYGLSLNLNFDSL